MGKCTSIYKCCAYDRENTVYKNVLKIANLIHTWYIPRYCDGSMIDSTCVCSDANCWNASIGCDFIRWLTRQLPKAIEDSDLVLVGGIHGEPTVLVIDLWC